MKICPNCQQTYQDDGLNFCLNDGGILEYANDAPPPTMIMEEPRKTAPDFNPSFSAPPSPWQSQPVQTPPPFSPPMQTPSYSASPPMYSTQTDQNLPIISLILGICTVVFGFCCVFLGVPLGLGAVVTGYMGMKNADENPQRYGGKNLAIGGMIMGGIGLLITFGLLFFSFLIR